jgi:hypothetical protein
VRRVGELLQAELEQRVCVLLEVDHPEAVRERLRRVAVGDAADNLVGEHEPEPDRELADEIRPPARQEAILGGGARGHPYAQF